MVKWLCCRFGLPRTPINGHETMLLRLRETSVSINFKGGLRMRNVAMAIVQTFAANSFVRTLLYSRLMYLLNACNKCNMNQEYVCTLQGNFGSILKKMQTNESGLIIQVL